VLATNGPFFSRFRDKACSPALQPVFSATILKRARRFRHPAANPPDYQRCYGAEHGRTSGVRLGADQMTERSATEWTCRKCGTPLSEARNEVLLKRQGMWHPCEGADSGCDHVQRQGVDGFEAHARAEVELLEGRFSGRH